MTKKRDGIREILESGQAPGFFIRGGGGKNASNPHEFAPDGRTRIPVDAHRAGLNPDQYEQIQEESVKEAEREAAETAKARKGTRRADGEIRHIGSIPAAEYYAKVRKDGRDSLHSSDAQEVKANLKRMGRLFKHEG